MTQKPSDRHTCCAGKVNLILGAYQTCLQETDGLLGVTADRRVLSSLLGPLCKAQPYAPSDLSRSPEQMSHPRLSFLLKTHAGGRRTDSKLLTSHFNWTDFES